MKDFHKIQPTPYPSGQPSFIYKPGVLSPFKPWDTFTLAHIPLPHAPRRKSALRDALWVSHVGRGRARGGRHIDIPYGVFPLGIRITCIP